MGDARLSRGSDPDVVTTRQLQRATAPTEALGAAALLRLQPTAGNAAVARYLQLACIMLVVSRRPRWALWAGLSMAGIANLSLVAFCYLWGKAFEYADANQPVPDSITTASNTVTVLWVAAVIGAMGMAAVTAVTARRAAHAEAH